MEEFVEECSARVFRIGDIVAITCMDGAYFWGVLQEFEPHYLIINGQGFALGMIERMQHA